MTFANPRVFLLLILPLLFLAWELWQYRRRYPTLNLPTLAGVRPHARPFRGYLKRYLFVLRALAVAFLVVALARPQRTFTEETVNTEGIDIILAIDISGSMRALDFKPDRLGAAKAKAREFIEGRENDRMGLVTFAGQSITLCPLTTDHTVLLTVLDAVQEDELLSQGTAIGMGLSTSVIRLKDSDAESRVVILLTDGVNNSGSIDPMTAAQAAKQFGIRVYTIGVGKNGLAPFPMQDFLGNTRVQQQEVRLDEELLQEIAEYTGGKYFQATNNDALGKVYEEIDELEKTRIEVTKVSRKTEAFHWFLIIGGLLFLLELLLRYAVVRYIP
ncbi:MAG: VWA domain-containing protein [Bacteroidetes bacterium]|nr:MAG: VWA domain-containing protein [Bacteroidota bacterium]